MVLVFNFPFMFAVPFFHSVSFSPICFCYWFVVNLLSKSKKCAFERQEDGCKGNARLWMTATSNMIYCTHHFGVDYSTVIFPDLAKIVCYSWTSCSLFFILFYCYIIFLFSCIFIFNFTIFIMSLLFLIP